MGSGLEGRAPACIFVAETLGLGASLEPLVDPKPGGVTRVRDWRGMDVYLFEKAAAALRAGLYAACMRGCAQGCLAGALRTYLSLSGRLGVTVNANLGTLLLMAPLACTWPAGPARRHAAEASRCARGLGGLDAEWYYRALEAFRPGHLGNYKGPVPGVGSGAYPGSMIEVLRAAEWDHVHRELLHGYPLTLEALGLIEEWGVSEDAIARVVLTLLARHGDTLIARKWGWRAMLLAMAEARVALRLADRAGIRSAVRWLRRSWEERGWNPGSILDIVAAALGLYYLGGALV